MAAAAQSFNGNVKAKLLLLYFRIPVAIQLILYFDSMQKALAGLRRINLEGLRWRVFDAKGQVLGRLASQISTVVQGKDKPTYAPNRDDGDMCIVLNAKDLCVTGRKLTDKFYRWHTGQKQYNLIIIKRDFIHWRIKLASSSKGKTAILKSGIAGSKALEQEILILLPEKSLARVGLYLFCRYVGNLKERSLKDQMAKDPTEVIRKAVLRMLPRNKLRDDRDRKLRIFAGSEHPFHDRPIEPYVMPPRQVREMRPRARRAMIRAQKKAEQQEQGTTHARRGKKREEGDLEAN
ncbi:hypothetical protein RJ640_028091, partial [Escallonia rubra]